MSGIPSTVQTPYIVGDITTTTPYTPSECVPGTPCASISQSNATSGALQISASDAMNGITSTVQTPYTVGEITTNMPYTPSECVPGTPCTSISQSNATSGALQISASDAMSGIPSVQQTPINVPEATITGLGNSTPLGSAKKSLSVSKNSSGSQDSSGSKTSGSQGSSGTQGSTGTEGLSKSEKVTQGSMTTRLTVKIPGRGVVAKPSGTTTGVAMKLQPHNLVPKLLTIQKVPTHIWLSPVQGTQNYLTVQVAGGGIKLP